MKNFESEGKKFKSVIRRIVWIPMFTMLFILIITFTACVYSWVNLSNQLIDRNVNSLQVTMAQLEGLMEQVENHHINYVASSDNYRFLNHCDQNTPKEKLVGPTGEVRSWLRNQVNLYNSVRCAFAYYKNIDFLQFIGITNADLQELVREEFLDKESFGHEAKWHVRQVDGQFYLIYVFEFGNFCSGVWMPISQIRDMLGIDNAAYIGSIYIADKDNFNTLSDEQFNQVIMNGPLDQGRLTIDKSDYAHHYVESKERHMRLGILIPRIQVFKNIPAASWLLFAAAIIAVVIVGSVILWLRRRIAAPVKDMDQAMKIIAEGNIDYRLEPPHLNYYNEFDNLAHRFNAMLDELEEVQYNLYETKIREQRAELKYISQQIRPHFILNDLNIIYTYDESEIHLVKKMAKYLSNYFRYIVNLRADFVEVSKELDHVRNYLNIQKERYPDRFDYLVDCSEKTSRMLIPPLIIQTFVENCVKYGMLDDKESFFYVTVLMEGDRILIIIADTGRGFDDATLEKLNAFVQTREYRDDLGVGVQNAVERMDILYGEKVEVHFDNEVTGGALVRILLPAKTEEDDRDV